VSFLRHLSRLLFRYTSPSIPVVECTTLTMEFKEGGKRQFVYHKLLDTLTICDNLNAIFEEHQGLEIVGDVEVFKYERTGDQENESLNFLPIRD